MSNKEDGTQSFAQLIADFRKQAAENGGDNPIIVDFDETLWLRNSTEEFLDRAWPKAFIAPLLALVDDIKPWRLARIFGADARSASFAGRDWCRLVLVLLLTPWNFWRWRRNAAELAKAFANKDLLDFLGTVDAARVVVATFGMGAICRPLLDELLPGARFVGMPFWNGPGMRRRGKLSALRTRLSDTDIQQSIFLTDHPVNDADVIEAVPKSFVGQHPDAKFQQACTSDYVPFRYTLNGKHVGRNHVLRVFVGEDFAVLALATLPVAANPVIAGLACLLLVLSFFIIYETGYHENDRLGAEREVSPIITDARRRLMSTMDTRIAWVWAILFALPGIGLLTSSGASHWQTVGGGGALFFALFAGWIALLAFTRALFAVFNRINEKSRTIFYLPLQLCKGALAVIVLGLPVHLAGLALLVALPIARWIPYLIYRHTGDRSSLPDQRFYRLLITLTFAAVFPFVATGGQWSTLGAVAVVVWCVLTARKNILEFWRNGHWLKPLRPPPDDPS